MMICFWTSLNSRGFLLLVSLVCCFFPGAFSFRVVTLRSIQIFNTHEWFNTPTVYFNCKGEERIILPDVKEAHVLYTFKGEESWQPMTELPNKKCKRCGFYKMGTLISDDVFDEWEFCSSDFIDPDGNYERFKDKEFNATFFCPQCVNLGNSSQHASGSHYLAILVRELDVRLVILISAMVPTVSILGAIVAYRYSSLKKRKQGHAQLRKAS